MHSRSFFDLVYVGVSKEKKSRRAGSLWASVYGPVWDRGLGKRIANKPNAALSSLLVFLAAPVHLAASPVERGCATRVRRRTFGGIFFILSLKRVVDAVPNRAYSYSVAFRDRIATP